MSIKDNNYRPLKFIIAAALLLFVTVLIGFNNVSLSSPDKSLAVIPESEFAADSGLSAFPNGEIVAVFLEARDDAGEENDTGAIGQDVIPYSYAESMEQTFCWDDDNPGAKHYMTLVDSRGDEVLTAYAGEDCVTALVPEGEYEMQIYHDAESDDRIAVFIVPREDRSVLSVTTDDALENLLTLLNTNKCNGCDLSGINLYGADLSGIDFSGAILNYAILVDADLTNADLSNSVLTNADLSRAVLTGADLAGADLTNAILINTNLTDADLTMANMENADTGGAILTGVKTEAGVKAEPGEAESVPAESGDSVQASALMPVMCDSGNLPGGGSGEDLRVTGECTVIAGTYKYGNVNIYDGGSLVFTDADIEFWAKSILVENNSSLIAGTPETPIGNTGTLTIHLYGNKDDLAGIECMTDTMCGVPAGIWNSNTLSVMNPPSCVKSIDAPGGTLLPGGVDDCFYQYKAPDPLSGETGFFGSKVLAVSYGGTLQMYGVKGANIGDGLPSSSSGTSWARLDTGNILQKDADSLTLDRSVNWTDGDQVVITTTDYLPAHSEKLLITNMTSGSSFEFDVLDPYSNLDPGSNPAVIISDGLQYPHNGKTYPVNTPERLGLSMSEAETRAAVALLTRSIRIVSGGDDLMDPFGPPTPGSYFGGQVMIRQGAENVQIQGVEFYQLGQGARKGRYPLHFHLSRKMPDGTFVKDCSIHDSMTRWITLHGAQNVTLARNVGYMSIGHGFYIEDGTEINNKLYSNIGILARAAIKSQTTNPREVPGILANTVGKQGATTDAPYRSDYIQPAVFWIMNGWNDFEYNMAAGATACGICYWWLPSAISGPSQMMKWDSYASQQSNLARAGDTPLKDFTGNYCTSAMNSFNTTTDISPCLGMGGPVEPFFDPVETGNLSPVPVKGEGETYYPKLGNLHRPTLCDSADCSTVPTCSAGSRANCDVTVIDKYTSAFNWTETNFSAIWLRPQWYLVTNSVISDVQSAGLTFVTGGDYTESNFIPGQWQLARKNVFIGQTQDGNGFASHSGPVNPDTNLTCAKDANKVVVNDRCFLRDEAVTIPLANFANNQRMYNIYDGPNFEDSNAFLNIKRQSITDCNLGQGSCASSQWMYGRVPLMPYDHNTNECYLPNAAIAWKQPNGFYYPPAFHSANLYFDDVEIRHFIINPLFNMGGDFAFQSNDTLVMQNYCTFSLNNPQGTGGSFGNFSAIDRQTILNDDDGTLTGLRDTISVNEDPFFNTPVETLECASAGTAKTSPYDHVTTVVYPGCVAEGDCGGTCSESGEPCADTSNCTPTKAPDPPNLCQNTTWTDDCGSSFCYGVPLYRQYLTRSEQSNTVGQEIRMMGMNFFQRSNLTANNGLYYIDTSVSEERQRDGLLLSPGQQPSLNVFQGGETYYVLLIFAKDTTKQTYLIHVGQGFDPEADVNAVTSRLKTTRPLDITPRDWPANWERKWYKNDPSKGILEVTVDYGEFSDMFAQSVKDRCQPKSFCEWSGDVKTGSCQCSTELMTTNPELYEECTQELGPNGNTMCDWPVRSVDCPEGGCLGFSFKLPDNFEYDVQPPLPRCYPDDEDSPWVINGQWSPVGTDLAGQGCNVHPLPDADFCSGIMIPTIPIDIQPPVGGSPMPDTDGDGLIDAIDADADNDGIPDAQEIANDVDNASTANRAVIPADPDGDGIPNELDLDSDGDCIPDHIEGGGHNDANSDGVSDNFSDNDGDGLNDVNDPDQGGAALPLPDTDGDGIPNFLDQDSDNDGLTDTGETGGPGDANDDGVIDDTTDADHDGLADIVEPGIGTPCTLLDTDQDGLPDYLDIVLQTPEEPSDNNGDGDSSGGCSVAGPGGVKGGLAGLLVYALIPAGVLLRRRLRKASRG